MLPHAKIEGSRVPSWVRVARVVRGAMFVCCELELVPSANGYDFRGHPAGILRGIESFLGKCFLAVLLIIGSWYGSNQQEEDAKQMQERGSAPTHPSRESANWGSRGGGC